MYICCFTFDSSLNCIFWVVFGGFRKELKICEMGHEKSIFLHSPHNFGVCLLVLIFLFGKLRSANKKYVRNEYEKHPLKLDNWLKMPLKHLYCAHVLEHKSVVSFTE